MDMQWNTASITYEKVKMILLDLDDVEAQLNAPELQGSMASEQALKHLDDARLQIKEMVKLLQAMHRRPESEALDV